MVNDARKRRPKHVDARNYFPVKADADAQLAEVKHTAHSSLHSKGDQSDRDAWYLASDGVRA